ncbi:MAG TPA: hypothetical protein VHR84_12000 [Terriglobales bacterium]|nr:hypothetical protein [Terriglobales bacterium]
MRTLCRFLFLVSLFCLSLTPLLADDVPKLLIVPSKATIVVGDSQSFRAVGQDGRALRNVHWRVSPDYAVRLTSDDQIATLIALQPSSSIILTANAGTESAEATLEVRSGSALPIGTAQWTVQELPGCKTIDITPAVPSSGGPDVYVKETCSDGDWLRAITAEGHELWRRKFSNGSSPIPLASRMESPNQHLNSTARSVCDDISVGMSRANVFEIFQTRHIVLGRNETSKSIWSIEEQNFNCQVFFNSSGGVVRKKKTVVVE